MNAFAGLDVHKNKCHGTILNEDGETLKDEEFENSLSGIKNFFRGFATPIELSPILNLRNLSGALSTSLFTGFLCF